MLEHISSSPANLNTRDANGMPGLTAGQNSVIFELLSLSLEVLSGGQQGASEQSETDDSQKSADQATASGAIKSHGTRSGAQHSCRWGPPVMTQFLGPVNTLFGKFFCLVGQLF